MRDSHILCPAASISMAVRQVPRRARGASTGRVGVCHSPFHHFPLPRIATTGGCFSCETRVLKFGIVTFVVLTPHPPFPWPASHARDTTPRPSLDNVPLHAMAAARHYEEAFDSRYTDLAESVLQVALGLNGNVGVADSHDRGWRM